MLYIGKDKEKAKLFGNRISCGRHITDMLTVIIFVLAHKFANGCNGND